jgi:uncharacterized protein YjbI with pentapeptide repeats
LKEAIAAETIAVWNDWRRDNQDIVPDLQGADLSGANLRFADLQAANLSRSNLRFANLEQANLDKANLSESNLCAANLTEARLCRANLSKAKLAGIFLRSGVYYGHVQLLTDKEPEIRPANLNAAFLRYAILQEAKLNGVCFNNADLSGADLLKANLREAQLMETNLTDTRMSGADLSGANCERAVFERADLRRADLRNANLGSANVYAVKFDRWGKYRGITVEGCKGSPLFRRFAQDQEFIEEFRDSGWKFPVYLLWLTLADCGRSLLLWTLWCVLAVLGFACRYWTMELEAFKHLDLPWQPATAVYYSVVTFTTLGFGDIAPMTIPAAMWVMAEVILGYVMLGGLISIFANKLARRS